MADYIAHHGIKGQKWGVRRFQNEDGTYTEEGKARYVKADGTLTNRGKHKIKKIVNKEAFSRADSNTNKELDKMSEELKKTDAANEFARLQKKVNEQGGIWTWHDQSLGNRLVDQYKKEATDLFEKHKDAYVDAILKDTNIPAVKSYVDYIKKELNVNFIKRGL